MDKNENKSQVEIIKEEIDEVLKNIEKIKTQTSEIQNAVELAEFEKAVARETDKLAGLLTAKTIQETLDSGRLKQQAGELIQSMPQKMESQGLRDVTIKPLRGGAVTVKASYYTQKKRKKKRKKKKP